MQVIDLRRRISMQSAEQDHIQSKYLITFETGGDRRLALLVDDIEGLKRISNESIEHFSGTISHQLNMHLLFPLIGKLGDGTVIHLMDATYLEKIEPISDDDGGELEMF